MRANRRRASCGPVGPRRPPIARCSPPPSAARVRQARGAPRRRCARRACAPDQRARARSCTAPGAVRQRVAAHGRGARRRRRAQRRPRARAAREVAPPRQLREQPRGTPPRRRRSPILGCRASQPAHGPSLATTPHSISVQRALDVSVTSGLTTSQEPRWVQRARSAFRPEAFRSVRSSYRTRRSPTRCWACSTRASRTSSSPARHHVPRLRRAARRARVPATRSPSATRASR